ncbi:MAG: hypothetical protein KGJ13_06150 [Patescibacteria group bacterium]|nr:hypothetical protein [Patescibacteria group bacterium]
MSLDANLAILPLNSATDAGSMAGAWAAAGPTIIEQAPATPGLAPIDSGVVITSNSFAGLAPATSPNWLMLALMGVVAYLFIKKMPKKR